MGISMSLARLSLQLYHLSNLTEIDKLSGKSKFDIILIFGEVSPEYRGLRQVYSLYQL